MKKVVSLLLVFTIVFSLLSGTLITSEAYTAHSQYEAVSWVNSQVGKALDYDGVYGAQCVDLTKYYYAYLGVPVPSGNANQYVNGGKYCPSGWSYQSSPQPGDIAVWTGGDYGHVAIVTEIRGLQMVCVEQNYAGKQYCTANLHSINAQKYIRPDFNNGNNPIGTVDSIEGKSGAIFISGWAFDKDDTSKQLEIHVYIGGEPHAIIANKERKDVNKAYGCGDYHGYSAVIKTSKSGTQNVEVYAINIGGGNNVGLGSKSVKIINPNPIGAVDSIEGKCGSVFVSGWAFDEDNTSKSLEIHVYIGGEPHAIIANKERKDVNKAYGCGDYHGYSAEIKTSKSGTQKVEVYAINTGNGSNVGLGSKTVSIKSHTWNSGKITRKATLTATGIKTYTCTVCGDKKTQSFACPKTFTLAKTSYVYTGKAITPAVTVKDSEGKVLKKGTDYTLSYSNNKAVGTAKATITFKGKYSGTKTLSFKILPKGTSLAKLTPAKRAFTARWNKQVTQTTGYQIQYATNNKFTGAKTVTVKKAATLKYTVKNLAAKKAYYVRVRTYKTMNKVNYYSTWSATKAVKTK